VAKSVLDKDLKKVVRIETATYALSRSLATPGLLAVFLIGSVAVASASIGKSPLSLFVIVAAVIAAYMALNIGANDVANNMGPAVGSRALTLSNALIIAAIAEVAGAVLAGGDVVTTVSSRMLQPGETFPLVQVILIMTAALLAAAGWIHLATFVGAPISTTHAIVGGVVGAGIAAAGVSVVQWPVIWAIVASWVISPLMGGVIAAILLGFVKFTIIYRENRVHAARRWVPALVALMSGTFAMYIVTKGLSRVWNPGLGVVLVFGAAFFALGYFVARPWVLAHSAGMENRRKHVSRLFELPLICAGALLSSAHGANDVANAVGPLAAIVSAAETGSAAESKVVLPLWVLLIGAVGIAVGLGLFGARVIRTVGEKITKMDAIRAYCVALSAAITVLVASALGLPVS
jgi:PiT family inorganic phosphate transporter